MTDDDLRAAAAKFAELEDGEQSRPTSLWEVELAWIEKRLPD